MPAHEVTQDMIRPDSPVLSISETRAQRGDNDGVLLAKLTELLSGGATGGLKVGGSTKTVDVTFSLDAGGAYAAGDVLADSQVIAACMRVENGTGVLSGFVLSDEDAQGIELDVVLLSANVALGAENAAVSITDADARNILGIVNVPADAWVDLGAAKVATLLNVNVPVKAVTGTEDLYVALITRGAPTHTASGIRGRFTFFQD